MRAVDIIIKKREKEVLTREEIEFFIRGLTSGEIPDYQVSAWAMAVLLNGMTAQETTDLTLAMANSGDVIDLSGIVPIAVDKHSTGGVGDKTTLVVEPTIAACGLAVGKMSGRGLGFSGGTLDKLESIPGYRTDLSKEEFLNQLSSIGLVLTGQSSGLAPADGKLYALRDVTGTVQSIPLIASSVMSKKIAAGAQAIILDVKTGNGAFMETESEARKLAEVMVSIGQLSGRRVIAVIADMNQPLGKAVGNALEVKEAIATLHNQGPEDFREHCLYLAANLLVLGRKADTLSQGRSLAEAAIKNGEAWEYFRKLVIAQNGDIRYVDQPEKLPEARLISTLRARTNGWVHTVHARKIGEASVLLGAGRARKSDLIDPGVGIIVGKKVGDCVVSGEPILTVYANNENRLKEALEHLSNACVVEDYPAEPLPLFYGVIGDVKA
jgi:pyrimidine-nucleoside phosphorylase